MNRSALRDHTYFALAILAGATLLLMLCFATKAFAAGDPVAVATTASDATWSLVGQYGWFWGGSLLLLGLGRALLKGNAASHWLAQGRTLAAIAGSLSVLGAVAEWHFNAAPAAGILITLVMAAKLVWQPVGNAATAPARDPQAGRAPIVVLAALATIALGLGITLGCGARQRVANGVAAFASCEAPDAKAALGDLVPLATSALKRWLSGDGTSYDTAGIKADAAKVKSNLGRCAFEGAIAVLTQPVEQPKVQTLLAPPDPGAQLAAAWPGIRGEIGWSRP